MIIDQKVGEPADGVSPAGSSQERSKVGSLAGTPRVISFLSMSLRMTPSLERAVEFTARNLDGDLSNSLKRMLWEVHTGKSTTIESAFRKFSCGQGVHNKSFERSMDMLLSSLTDRSDNDRKRTIKMANEIILSGVKFEIEKFIGSLKGPSMIMFAMGIVLPIILVTMLPVMGTGMDSIWWITLLMIVILPGGCFLYAKKILRRRPNFSYGKIENKRTSKKWKLLASPLNITPALLFTSSILIISYSITGSNAALDAGYGILLIITIAASIVSFYMLFPCRQQIEQHELAMKIERELPDAIYHLGLRISTGEPMERALVVDGAPENASETSALFTKLILQVRITGMSISRVLEIEDEIMVNIPDSVRSILQMVNEAVEKNSSGAGDIIMDISNYLRDLRKLEEDMMHKMKEVLDTIYQTGVIFAPMIIGLSTSMYFKLNDSLSGLDTGGGIGFIDPGSTQPIPAELLLLIFGIYTLLMVCVITYFVTGMESGRDFLLVRKKLAPSLIISSIIFSVSSLAGMQVFG
jgi:Flp pilus assembly protein TadB